MSKKDYGFSEDYVQSDIDLDISHEPKIRQEEQTTSDKDEHIKYGTSKPIRIIIRAKITND